MYLFYVYIQKGEAPDMLDDIYSKMICTYREVADYVQFLNSKVSNTKYYFMRKSAYIDTDSIITD